MRSIVCILFLLSHTSSNFAQTISGQIRNAKSNEAIPHATIYIDGKNTGTISDSLGNFKLSLEKALDTDTLRISIIGYSSQHFKISDIRKAGLPQIVYMTGQIIQLDEVTIINQQNIPAILGLPKKYCYPIPLYKGASSKVAFPQKDACLEIGTRFNNRREIYLDSIQLNFAECNVDKVDLSLKIYRFDQEDSLKLVFQQHLTLKKNDALACPVVDLDEQILAVSDFLVSIEASQEVSDGAVYIYANFKRKGKPYPTYYRKGSTDDWKVMHHKKSGSIGLSILAYGHLFEN